MKPIQLITFLSIFFGIYFLGNWYLYNRANLALPAGPFKQWFPWIFWGLAVTFLIGQFLERGNYHYGSQIVTYFGSFWLVFAFYCLLMVALIDVVRLTNYLIPFIPQDFKNTWFSGKHLFTAVVAIASIIVIAGHINALVPKIRTVDLLVDKKVENRSELKIALVSDIHMGFIIGNNRVKRLVRKLNNEKPDIILFAGDLVDHNPKPVIAKDLGRHLKKLKAPLGIYAVTGNHEFIGHPEVSIDYLTNFGIRYLRDTAITIDHTLVLAGRDDKDGIRYTGARRLPVSKLLNGVDRTLPIILMDHQPVDYDSVALEGVDLMVSGHTHRGQFWPFSIITRKVFENDWGFMKRGKTNFYVSSGYGTWGPPVRVGSRSEIVILNMHLN